MFKRILAVAAVSLVGASTAHAETLRLTSFEPPSAYITSKIIAPWAEEVTAASNGALKIELFAGGTLGRSPAQQLKLVEDGVADIAWVIPGYTPGRFDAGTVGELPFLVQNSATGSKAMWSMYEQGHFKGDYEKFKLLCVCVSSPAFIGATKEIRIPDDVRGLKMRAPGPTQLKVLEALGAIPVGGITATTAAEAISRGVIEGTLLEFSASETFSMDEVITHYNTVRLGATPMLVLMNRQRFDGLPEAAKAAVDQFAGEAFSTRFGTLFDAYVAGARQRIAAQYKPSILDPDAELSKQWKAAVQPATDAWIAGHENGQAIYDAFAKALAANAGGN